MYLLQVFIADHCPGCDEALSLAEEAEARFPGLEVQVVNLDEEGERPEAVFAVPTFLLNEEVLCLGNPERHWLFQRLTEAEALSKEDQL